MAQLFSQHDPSLIGNDYLVLGTVERKAWRESVKQPKSTPDMLEHLHGFEEVLTLNHEYDGEINETWDNYFSGTALSRDRQHVHEWLTAWLNV